MAMIPVHIKMEPEMLKAIEDAAGDARLNRSEWVRKAIKRDLELCTLPPTEKAS